MINHFNFTLSSSDIERNFDYNGWSYDLRKERFINNITAACMALVRFGVPNITNPRFDHYLQINNDEFSVELMYEVKYHNNSDIERIMLNITHDSKPDWYYYYVANDIVKARIMCAWPKLPDFQDVVICDNDFHLVFRDGSTYKITLQQLVKREKEVVQTKKNMRNYFDIQRIDVYAKKLKAL